MAARRRSVPCGPPEVIDYSQLEESLQRASGSGWVRGVQYHESIAGDLTSRQIDQWINDRPVRIQHRSGRVWYFNSLGAEEIGLPPDRGGQLYRNDDLVFARVSLQESLAPELREVSREMARFGVTHVTDATPTNDDQTVAFLRGNCLDLRIRAMGGPQLREGHLKIILDDYRLPDFHELCDLINKAHQSHRPVAIHCVSKVEVVFAISALNEVGSFVGDRLEHATEMTSDIISNVDNLRLHIVPNPNFLYERGDQYIQDNDLSVLDSLYPVRSILACGIQCSFGSDAPFGDADPWRVISAATNRRTRNGAVIGSCEAIEPEEALALFTDRDAIEIGSPADLVCLDRSWSKARSRLVSSDVRATVLEGQLTYLRE